MVEGGDGFERDGDGEGTQTHGVRELVELQIHSFPLGTADFTITEHTLGIIFCVHSIHHAVD